MCRLTPHEYLSSRACSCESRGLELMPRRLPIAHHTRSTASVEAVLGGGGLSSASEPFLSITHCFVEPSQAAATTSLPCSMTSVPTTSGKTRTFRDWASSGILGSKERSNSWPCGFPACIEHASIIHYPGLNARTPVIYLSKGGATC